MFTKSRYPNLSALKECFDRIVKCPLFWIQEAKLDERVVNTPLDAIVLTPSPPPPPPPLPSPPPPTKIPQMKSTSKLKKVECVVIKVVAGVEDEISIIPKQKAKTNPRRKKKKKIEQKAKNLCAQCGKGLCDDESEWFFYGSNDLSFCGVECVSAHRKK
ncbi:hypothetical protein ACOME3_005029 [Neoechinorhynchus agilis]